MDSIARLFNESASRGAARCGLEGTGWRMAHGPDIAPDMPAGGRRDSGDVVRAQRLCDSLLPKIISGELRVEVGSGLPRGTRV